MKTIVMAFGACFVSGFPLRSNGQELAQAEVGTTVARARIPDALNVEEFVPPAPVVPKLVPTMRVDAAVTVPSANGKTLTIFRGEASTLPDLPAPKEQEPVVKLARTAEDEERAIYRRRHSISLGATVLDRSVSVVRWQHPDTREAYEAICGFDVSLVAGVGRFERDGETYSLMLMNSHVDTTRLRKPGVWGGHDVSSVAAASVHVLKGDAEDPVGTAPIRYLAELLSNEKVRLQLFQGDLSRHKAARTSWERANPILARDETVWLRPHRGSRYLAEPMPESKAR